MLKHAWLMSAFAVALVATPSEAQERRAMCAWTDVECMVREQDRERQEARADQRRDVEQRRDVDYDRKRAEVDRIRCTERDRRGECERWEREHDDRGRRGVRHGRLPHMTSALAIRNGNGVPKDARMWLGRGPFRVELENRDRDRVPERATIHSTRTRETQVWIDRNNDGWADRILFYHNGRLVRDVK
jgi:hypothetical protein